MCRIKEYNTVVSVRIHANSLPGLWLSFVGCGESYPPNSETIRSQVIILYKSNFQIIFTYCVILGLTSQKCVYRIKLLINEKPVSYTIRLLPRFYTGS